MRGRHLISCSGTASASFGQRRNSAFNAHDPSMRASWPSSEEVLCAADAARRFDTLLLRRPALAGWLPPLERRRNISRCGGLPALAVCAALGLFAACV
jgi:hypothetical protein